MWPVGLAKAEACAEVVDEVGLLLEGCEKGLVDGLLVGNTVLCGLFLLHNSSVLFAFAMPEVQPT